METAGEIVNNLTQRFFHWHLRQAVKKAAKATRKLELFHKNPHETTFQTENMIRKRLINKAQRAAYRLNCARDRVNVLPVVKIAA